MDETSRRGDVYRRLMLASTGLVGAGRVHGMKGRGAADNGARSRVLADATGGVEPHRPTTQMEVRVDLNSRKGRAGKAPAKFTDLRLVSSRCLDTASPTRNPRAVVSKHLVLVWSQ